MCKQKRFSGGAVEAEGNCMGDKELEQAMETGYCFFSTENMKDAGSQKQSLEEAEQATRLRGPETAKAWG